MADEAVIIAGALDAKELEKSIDSIVDMVSTKSTKMATDFSSAMDTMSEAMKKFAVSQKVSTSVIREAWKEVSASFDAMFSAESAAKGGGGKGKGKTVYEDNTIGALEQSIKLEKERRKEMELGSDVLRTQNNLIMERTNRLKAEKRGQMSLTEVLGMDESSIDAVRLKLNALKFVKIDPNNAEDVKRLGDAYANLSIRQTQMMGKNAQLVDSNQALARSFNYIRNRIIYMLTVGTLGSFIKEIYEVRGQYELLERSLGVLVNSLEQGRQIFQELNQMSLESPFTLMELAGAAKQLTAYNFSAKEVVDTTRRLADISAALGVPMERLTYNLGQIRAQTVLTARDARDFANAGLPIVKSLSDYYTELEGKVVSTGEVYSRMSKKMVSYSDVMAVLNKMTDEGGKFFEFQAKQAQTLRVQIANLQLAYNNMLNEIGEGSQTAISLPIKGLKLLFQNWDSIGRVLKNIVLTFGLLRVAQMIAIRNNLAWAASATTAARQMNILSLGIQKLGASLKALAANPWAGAFAVIFAVSDLIGQHRRNVEEVAKLNEEIRKGAEEASQSNLDFLSNKGNQATLKLAQEGKLTAEQGEKAWESIEEQIDQSSQSANKLIAELLTIEDVNERVSKGFDYVASIQKAQAALRDLKDDTIAFSQDIGWGGMFGEGLVSDLKDYANQTKEYLTILSTNPDIVAKRHSENKLSNSQKEFQKELEETAQSIKRFIDVHNITDPLQINEILERARAVIKLKNPEIKGDLETLFDVSLDQRMFELTNGAVDANTSLWEMFMERLKHNSSAAFQDITNDIYKKNATLTKEQQDAVDKNLEYFKNTMPWYYDAVKKMVDDASKLRINIGIAFGVQQLTDFQEEVNKRIANAPKVLDFGTEAMLPTQNDNLSSWAKTQRDTIAKLQEENAEYSKDSTAWSKEQIKNNETEIQQRKNLLDLFKQSYTKDKKGGSKQDPLGDAVQKNIQYVNEIRKKYEEYRKEGLNTNEALEEATKHYSKSLARVNQELSKYGIQGLTGEQLATMNLQQVRDYFQGMLNGAQGSAKAVEALEKALMGVDGEIIKFRQKAVIDGLNSELSKLKDEYELAVELDADPEMGNMFADMFGIDTKALPHTFGEAYEKALEIAKNKLREAKLDVADFDLMSANFAPDKEGKWNGVDVNSDLVKGLISLQKTWRDIFKKNLVDTENALDEYVKKYGDYSDKVAEIEAKKLERIKRLDDAYYTEEMRQSAEYQTKLNAINKGAEREESTARFDQFKESRYYTMMFENLDYISTKTIRDMRDHVRNLIDTMNDLTPEQLKHLLTQYEKLEQKLTKRSPFKTLGKDVKEYLKTLGSRKEANKAFRDAQKQVDLQREYLTDLKKEHEVLKRNPEATQAQIDMHANLINEQDKELDLLLKILDAKQKEADKYNLTAKLAKSEMLAVAGVVAANLQGLGELRDFIQDDLGVELSDELNGLIDGLQGVGNGINSIISSAQSGNVTGVIAGVGKTIYGLYDGIASIFGGGSSKNKKIDKAIKESEREMSKLENTINAIKNAYDQLSNAADRSYGLQKTGAQLAMRENQALQLQYYQMQMTEKKRQLELEKSRSSKKRDEDRINSLEGEIISLQGTINSLTNDVANAVADITDELLGISRSSWAEDLATALIDAFKQGEDYMEVFKGKWDDMVDHMIMKIVVGKLVGDYIEKHVFGAVDDIVEQKTAQYAKNEANLLQASENWKNFDEDQRANAIMANLNDPAVQEAIRRAGYGDWLERHRLEDGTYWGNPKGKARLLMHAQLNNDGMANKIGDQIIPIYEEWAKQQAYALEDATEQATLEAYKQVLADPKTKAGAEALVENLPELLEPFGITYGQDSEKQLSGLQAGIQGLSEETGSAIESYMNIISQRIFEHGGILTEIRDIVASFDMDIQLGVQQQMLLQLQSSYQVQMTIQGILQGWSNASGLAVRVEMV